MITCPQFLPVPLCITCSGRILDCGTENSERKIVLFNFFTSVFPMYLQDFFPTPSGHLTTAGPNAREGPSRDKEMAHST
ncbi:hypothetical protein OUZ56_030165 [Daphnia magna]|uniref:Uncharacterized protein n=1 Tax=Daphnia magna TaxID=35525 RepID=A0ABQ9ZQG1_9CRUS|nr:hypothetical protein OUZ56_030165 [Daphnia magna]